MTVEILMELTLGWALIGWLFAISETYTRDQLADIDMKYHLKHETEWGKRICSICTPIVR